ncbi:hypothetical protein H2248_002897 [Termitomyces sp. 'cryptogamus']|nr:hypothetical protein H2248_002897 [Termitomyces sp. 'cryptogamus']
MSFSLAQDQGASSTLVAQGNGPMYRLPTAENPFTSTTVSISTATLIQTGAAVPSQQTAPQFDDSPIGAGSSPSSQPPLTILFSLPTASLASVLLSSPAPTTVATSVPMVSVLSDSFPVLSTTMLPVTSIVTLAAATSTPFASTSAEMAPASGTPTATTVTQATADVPSTSPSQSVTNDSAVTEEGHHAPFYIAVIVGTILAIGLIAAVIAWAVRLWMHARRRRENPLVPWANHLEARCPLERARDATFIGQPINRSASKDISSQDVIPWEPCGDRDVGEPKRSNSHLRSSLHSSLVPDPVLHAEHHAYPVRAHNAAYPAPYYHGHAVGDTNMASDGTLDGYSSLSSLGPLHIANRTPGDISPSSSCTSPGNMNIGHTGWINSGPRPRFSESYNEGTSRSNIPPRTRSTEEAWYTLPLPRRTQDWNDETITDDSSSWTASIKSNVTNAFNTVAASLPSGAAFMINRQDKKFDGLSPRPTRSSARRSVFSFFSRANSSASQPWTLEERGDGTGRVVFHDVEADGYDHGSDSQADSATRIRHTLSTRDAISSCVAQPPQSAMFTPNECDTGLCQGRSLRQPSIRSTLSTASSSSAYSMASAVSSIPRLPALSRHSTIKMDSSMVTVFERGERIVPRSSFPKRPATLVARSSSSGCSVYSYYYATSATHAQGGESTEDDESNQHALMERRSRRIV